MAVGGDCHVDLWNFRYNRRLDRHILRGWIDNRHFIVSLDPKFIQRKWTEVGYTPSIRIRPPVCWPSEKLLPCLSCSHKGLLVFRSEHCLRGSIVVPSN